MMKFWYSLLAFCLLLTYTAMAQYRIEVTIEGLEKEEDIMLGFYYGKVKSVVDTARITNGKATFAGADNLAKGLYFVNTSRGGFEILVADQQFAVTVEAPDFINTMQVVGSEQAQSFNSLQREIVKNQQVYAELARKAQSNPEQRDELQQQMETLNIAINDFQHALARKYQGVFLGKLVNMMTRPSIPETAPKNENGYATAEFQRWFYRHHFFDNIDFNEPNLLMTPIYHARLDEYIDQLTAPHPDSAKVAVDRLLEKSKVSRPFYRYTLTALTGKFETLRQPWGNIVFDYLARDYFLAGKADWMDDKLKFMLNAKVTTAPPKNKIGDAAPSIQGTNKDGKPINLQNVEGKYIVLYFYDPDCSHCRQQTPILKNVYDMYRTKGLEVMAVNIGSDPERWKKYIEEKSLTWVNAMGGETSSQLMQDYHIMSTPSVYILDENKNILVNYLKVPELETYFAQKLGD